MRTDELIAMFANGADTVEPHALRRRYGLALGWGAFGTMPLFGALMWAMKGLAPTRLALAGAAIGLLSGTGGALVYALYCTEMAAPFIGIWYLLGMLIPTALGAMLGPRLLRW